MDGVTQTLALVVAALSYALIRASTMAHARIHEAQLEATARNSCEANRSSARNPTMRRAPTRIVRSGIEQGSSNHSGRSDGAGRLVPEPPLSVYRAGAPARVALESLPARLTSSLGDGGVNSLGGPVVGRHPSE